LTYSTSAAYFGGVLSANGDIHFVPSQAQVGQKININGNITTYSLSYVHTAANNAYGGGVLSPDGEIFFVPMNAPYGQKINIDYDENYLTPDTYSLIYSNSAAYSGGVLTLNGDIHFIPSSASVGLKISTLSGIPFDLNVCISPFFNKL
jgi:hypothetical protein